MAKTIMIQGTMSDVGKTVIAAGLCRVFAQDGHSVAPFKSQNMACESHITEDGLEIGTAQAMQAEAALIKPDARMNPILLKPSGEQKSRVIINGRPTGEMSGAQYFAMRQGLIPKVKAAFDSLAGEHDIIVIEGAGSPCELNLNRSDIVNMGMAKMAKAPVLLVGDIDRGGIFASLYGTVRLLEERERNYVKGLIINKFRGDLDILRPGLEIIERITEKPVLGVVSHIDHKLDDEDSLSCPAAGRGDGRLNIAVIKLPRMSNFNDFNPLSRFAGVSLGFAADPSQLGRPDLVIVPATQNIKDDLNWLFQSGMARTLCALAQNQTPIIGVAGGCLMLGERFVPTAGGEELLGLGIVKGRLAGKTGLRRRVAAGSRVSQTGGFFGPLSGAGFGGFTCEIESDCEGLAELIFSPGQQPPVLALFAHRVFDEGDLCGRLVELMFAKKGLGHMFSPAQSLGGERRAQFDALADKIRQSLDMDAIYRIMEEGIQR